MNIKLYSKSLVYKETINPDIIQNDISFSSQINWWFGVFILVLDLAITDTTFSFWDVIKIEKDWNVIYSWIVEEINQSATSSQYLEVLARWYASLLSRLLYNESYDYTIIKNDLASNIMSDIVDSFNVSYNYLTKNIALTIWNVQYETDYSTLLNVTDWVNNLAENYYWTIDSEWVFIFMEKPSTATHRITFEKDIFQFNVDEDSSEIVNKLFLVWASWTTATNESASATTYWVRAKKINDSQILDTASADIFIAKYFEENAQPKKKIQLVVDTTIWNTDLENAKVWESLNIVNLNHNLWNNLLIVKKTYTSYNITFDLESYDSFIKLIKE